MTTLNKYPSGLNQRFAHIIKACQTLNRIDISEFG
ncbi:hypothetical protein SAMN04490197_0826 [Pseudomonas orientalis]|uniref:Uncharacterized protein n=1 Tax=Pseudomonas orientalis TaxID=76758 RepID=A0A8B3XSX8_9PSED|nr:hypothetical protein C4J98_2547 [Pseudomonas orientalis]SDT91420.1 hypothetical protein SAMN04490197_0826 [Pseudomonas orientalis]